MARARKAPAMGPVRQNLEAFGVAILAAVLLKWFCIEAYQIPTSSMQPTLMGSSEAAVYDRILVDKLVQTFREPKRWDITVFKYPLQKNQSYVKRIGGMPNDRLAIAGGNLYQVEESGGLRTYTPLRKPDDLQAAMWKDVYPGRRLARSESKALGQIFGASPARAATEEADGFTLDPRGAAVRLFFRDEPDGGMVDRVWDGYPPEVARAIRDKQPLDQPQEIVPDVRLTATVVAEQVPDDLSFEIEVLRPGADKWTFALAIAAGQGRLEVRAADRQVLGASPAFPVELAAGTPARLGFAHVDDLLIAWRDGRELQRFDSAAWAVRDGCVLPFDHSTGKLQLPAGQKVIPQFVVKGKGKVALRDVRIDRDQHYTRMSAPEIIEVPPEHYYMLGDNTLQSVDSRGWTAITIGIDADDNVVPPDSPASVRTIRGNKRPMSLQNPPDRDETPIPIPGAGALVMIDEFGEILRLKAAIGPDWGPGRVTFAAANGGDATWVAPETSNAEGISFVPRADIQGRAVLVFYPSRPLSWVFRNLWPARFGFVR